MASSQASPTKRPRAPTITVDTSAAGPEHQQDQSESINESYFQDSNTLTVPSPKSRSHSWASDPTAVGSGHDQVTADTSLLRKSKKGDFDLLQPNPGEENRFDIDKGPFAFTPGHLSKLINPKNLRVFVTLGGLAGLEKGLRTDILAGLSIDETQLPGKVVFQEAVETPPKADKAVSDATRKAEPHAGEADSAAAGQDNDGFSDRKRVYGTNRLPERQSKSLLQLAWIALQDRVLILLSIAAVVSLALGLYQTFGQETHNGANVEWVEGVAIIVAIAIVVIVGSVNDWQKERQFRELNQKKEDRRVKVVRSGRPTTISVHDVLVGDVMMLEPGDIIPVDGIFINGDDLSCDESSATGESDLMKKMPAEDALKALLHDAAPKLNKIDPFIISGSKVLDGVGSFLVTAVGEDSSHGKTMMSLHEDPGMTPLQSKLNVLASHIAKIGSAAGALLFTTLLIKFLVNLPRNSDSPEEKGQSFLRILITAITIIVVAVPEGLPLAVTLSLAFATKKMTKENNLVRHLQSCETMGNATVICSDKTGTLTENVMTVVAGTMGEGGRFQFGDEDFDRTQPGEKPLSGSPTSATSSESEKHFPITQLSSRLDPEYRDLAKLAIIVNTTAFEGEEKGKQAFFGTKTETALLDLARRHLGLGPLGVERANNPVTRLFPFNSQRKCMGAVVPISGSSSDKPKYRLFVKGASEILLAQSCRTLGDPTQRPRVVAMNEAEKEEIQSTIFGYATKSLRTLGLAYRDFDHWPPSLPQKQLGDDGEARNLELSDLFNDLTWMGVVGIQDPVRQGVAEAVADCQVASVSVKMVTGDNVETARAIGRGCGILPDELANDPKAVMEGSEFRKMTDEERSGILKDLRILARSSPEDKKILVNALRAKSEIVAVTGDGTNDAPALKAADVGFSMGIAGTEVAKEASDIILMDDNFSSIVKALGWGRAINDSVKKFLQFQLTVNITAVFVTFVSAVADSQETSVLNAVQLLWVNLIMDTFAALALATDPPTGSLLHRKPEPRSAPLITLAMWKMIIGQSIYQLIVCFVLLFAGPKFLDYSSDELHTLIFNVFVFMQIFKLVNSRRIDNNLNIFEGLFRNWLFMIMMVIMVAGQVIIIFVGGAAFVVVPLDGAQWGISLVLGVLSIPIGALIRLFPDAWFAIMVKMISWLWPSWLRRLGRRKSSNNDEEAAPLPEQYNIDDALLGIKDDLEFLRRVRGGRIGALSDAFARSRARLQHLRQQSRERLRSRNRSRQSSRSSNRPDISPMMSVVGMPGIVAASVGGLSPGGDRGSQTGRPEAAAT